MICVWNFFLSLSIADVVLGVCTLTSVASGRSESPPSRVRSFTEPTGSPTRCTDVTITTYVRTTLPIKNVVTSHLSPFIVLDRKSDR